MGEEIKCKISFFQEPSNKVSVSRERKEKNTATEKRREDMMMMKKTAKERKRAKPRK